MRNLQFGSEALRPDGLLGVVLPSFVLLTEKLANVLLGVLLAEKLANVLLGVFRDTREGRTFRIRGVKRRRSVVAAQRTKKLKIKIKQEYDD